MSMADEANKRVFIAGASGAIGRRLCILLVEDGWQVKGTTRFAHKASVLRDIGVDPIIVDVYGEEKLRRSIAESQPSVVIHQLTDLPPALDATKMAEARVRNSRIRDIGTRNLLAASIATGVKRFVAQSIAFAYAPGPTPYDESAPLDVNGSEAVRLTVQGVASLEYQVLNAPLEGIVLRYGRLYGPGTGFDNPHGSAPLHVDAAADAARRAAFRGSRGIYNIAENDGTVSSTKAMAELGWNSGFRIC